MRDLPVGRVTFLFTDVEGSTKLLHELGADAYGAALSDHRRLIRDVCARHGGVEVDTQGDSFLFAFGDAAEALLAAGEAQESLASTAVHVRMGLHTGSPNVAEDGYVGEAVHLGARIASAGHGGQVLLSKQTRDEAAQEFELRDLGEHRLKDFDAPAWIYQLSTNDFPPLRTISNSNLPRPLSSFVGRDTEVAEVSGLIRDGARLVTLTGAGGSGKTRLSIESASTLITEFGNGVFWVDLAPVRDPALVSATIASTLGAKSDLAEHLSERHMLLVLDNLEQVVEAAPQLSTLLTSCANLRILVTSRELLRVDGEVEFAVPPLAEREALELFSARSGLEPSDTIAELCRRLDRLPLAVELAAARTGVLSPAQILERLGSQLDLLKGGRDTEARQQTLRATIEWSHDLLSHEEQGLFARLGVFAGGCSLEAAEEIARADLDVLQSLVSKSLVRHSDERFLMLETIREYASERLEESGEADDLRRRHAEYFLALSEEAEPSLLGPSPGKWLRRLEPELGNLRAALEWLEASGEGERVLRMNGALWGFWASGGSVVEGRDRTESALRADMRPTAARAKALNAGAYLAWDMGDMQASKKWAEEALELNRSVGDDLGIAFATQMLGAHASEDRDLERARTLFSESGRMFRELGDDHNALGVLRALAHVYAELGDRDRARALIEGHVVESRALGDKVMEAICLGHLANYAITDGRVDDAISLVKESSRLSLELGDRFMLAVEVTRFASLLAVVGRPAAAVRLLSSADVVRDELGGAFEPWNVRMNDRTLAAVGKTLDQRAFDELWEDGRRLTNAEAVELALAELESDL